MSCRGRCIMTCTGNLIVIFKHQTALNLLPKPQKFSSADPRSAEIWNRVVASLPTGFVTSEHRESRTAPGLSGGNRGDQFPNGCGSNTATIPMFTLRAAPECRSRDASPNDHSFLVRSENRRAVSQRPHIAHSRRACFPFACICICSIKFVRCSRSSNTILTTTYLYPQLPWPFIAHFSDPHPLIL